jgi:hypothetical protein
MEKKYNASVAKLFPEMPFRIRCLPVSDEGYPVPWFVSKVDGKWNFVGIEGWKIKEAHKRGICWVCGDRLGAYKSFPIGPMCAINRVTSEPPSHLLCANFSVKACPFLSRPKMVRNYKTMPEDQRGEVPGFSLDRNPGVVLVWTTRSYQLVKVPNGVLFSLGDPTSLSWWSQGRPATRAEIDHSIAGGMPALRELAEAEGPDAVAELAVRIKAAESLMPEHVQ